MMCLLVPPRKHNSDGEVGCLSLLSVNLREKLRPDVYPCPGCSKDGFYNYNRKEVFHDGMEEDIEKKLISTIESHLIYDTASSQPDFMSIEEIHDEIKKQFTHINRSKDNIFLVNQPAHADWCDFYLPCTSLLKLMAGPTSVDVHLMTFLVNCLNGPLYCRSMKHTHKVLGQDARRQ